VRGDEAQPAPARLAADVTAREVNRQRGEPRLERRGIAQAIEIAQRHHEDVVHQIGKLAVGAEEPGEDARDV